MSGICSRHQGYDPECQLCNTYPPTREDLLREIETRGQMLQAEQAKRRVLQERLQQLTEAAELAREALSGFGLMSSTKTIGTKAEEDERTVICLEKELNDAYIAHQKLTAALSPTTPLPSPASVTGIIEETETP